MSAPISCIKNVYFCFSPDCLRAKITETFGEICFISDTQYLTSFTVFSSGVLQMIIMSWKWNKKCSYDYFYPILEFQVWLAKNPHYQGIRHTNMANYPKSKPNHNYSITIMSSIHKIQNISLGMCPLNLWQLNLKFQKLFDGIRYLWYKKNSLLTEGRSFFLLWKPLDPVLQASQICLVQLEFHQPPNPFHKDLAGGSGLCYHLLHQIPIFWRRCWLFVICLEFKIILIA